MIRILSHSEIFNITVQANFYIKLRKNKKSPCDTSPVSKNCRFTKGWQSNSTCTLGQMESLWRRCVLRPRSASTFIIRASCGPITQVWPCPVSFLTVDCLVTRRANLPNPQSLSQVPYGRPIPIPLEGPAQERAPSPALLPLPWHCHRACPAHSNLPTLGHRTWRAALAYLTLTAVHCNQALCTEVKGNIPKFDPKCFFFLNVITIVPWFYL